MFGRAMHPFLVVPLHFNDKICVVTHPLHLTDGVIYSLYVPHGAQNFYASIPGIRKGMLYYPLEDGALTHVDMEDVGKVRILRVACSLRALAATTDVHTRSSCLRISTAHITTH